ncbi:bidirectional sugar transporter SWEET3a-like isoform X2 [Tasmannia lanceolata]|uniref:bidirectional sugar transporter SWEET3a-like isoform X2 n=1 Tax=Tasmannia lanceolata TaxID=3420 RepID=UPI0040638705
MAETLRLAVGVLGDIVSLLRYLVPVFTFRRIIMNRSVEEFSCFPYVATLLGCLAYGWYGFPVVSIGWQNLPLALINSTGALIQIIFILIYFWFAPAKKKKRVSLMLFPVIVVSCVTALVSTLALHDHQSRKVLVGSVGVVSTVIMQASPLVVVKYPPPLDIFHLWGNFWRFSHRRVRRDPPPHGDILLGLGDRAHHVIVAKVQNFTKSPTPLC